MCHSRGLDSCRTASSGLARLGFFVVRIIVSRINLDAGTNAPYTVVLQVTYRVIHAMECFCNTFLELMTRIDGQVDPVSMYAILRLLNDQINFLNGVLCLIHWDVRF